MAKLTLLVILPDSFQKGIMWLWANFLLSYGGPNPSHIGRPQEQKKFAVCVCSGSFLYWLEKSGINALLSANETKVFFVLLIEQSHSVPFLFLLDRLLYTVTPINHFPFYFTSESNSTLVKLFSPRWKPKKTRDIKVIKVIILRW